MTWGTLTLPATADRRLVQARDFIEAGFSDRITLTEIAGHACMSQYHFLRLFKSAFQITPHQYLTRRRIERAKAMLKSPNISVTDVCFDVGFQSLGSFSSLFTRVVGYSPLAYRIEVQKRALIHISIPQKQIPACFYMMFSPGPR